MSDIGTYQRMRPDAPETVQKFCLLHEVWHHHKDWKKHRQQWQDAKDDFGQIAPEAAKALTDLLGSEQDLEHAGLIYRESIIAYLQALEALDLDAAVRRGELTKQDLLELEVIQHEWERELELEAILAHQRDLDHDRER